MGIKTGIGWTHETWNLYQGCHHVSPGCENCYMFTDKRRYGQDPEIVVRSKAHTFQAPLRWEKAMAALSEKTGTFQKTLVFTSSWTDFFIAEADGHTDPETGVYMPGWRDEGWAIMRRCPHVHFQILTKRHMRLRLGLPRLDRHGVAWGSGWDNVSLGVTIETQAWADRRLPELLRHPAVERFASYEPGLEGLNLERYFECPECHGRGGTCLACRGTGRGLSWVIIGGESGPGARLFDVQWAEDMIASCRKAGVAVFMKQTGAVWAKAHGLRHPKGEDPAEWPESIRVREMPPAMQGAVPVEKEMLHGG